VSTFIVQRHQATSESVTGELAIDSTHECYTLEPPYAGPMVKPRCIPAGTYDLTVRFSPRFARMMPHVENVPGFEGVLIHWGNFPKDTDACTLVGEIVEENFVGKSMVEFNLLFQKILDAVNSGPQVITYLDAPMMALDQEIVS
jgi:hypothetical protein